jgi:hypothetical protein
MRKPRIGRPRTPKKLAKGSLLSVRFSNDERRALERAATHAGVRLSEWARRALIDSARALATESEHGECVKTQAYKETASRDGSKGASKASLREIPEFDQLKGGDH